MSSLIQLIFPIDIHEERLLKVFSNLTKVPNNKGFLPTFLTKNIFIISYFD